MNVSYVILKNIHYDIVLHLPLTLARRIIRLGRNMLCFSKNDGFNLRVGGKVPMKHGVYLI